MTIDLDLQLDPFAAAAGATTLATSRTIWLKSTKAGSILSWPLRIRVVATRGRTLSMVHSVSRLKHGCGQARHHRILSDEVYEQCRQPVMQRVQQLLSSGSQLHTQPRRLLPRPGEQPFVAAPQRIAMCERGRLLPGTNHEYGA